MARFGTCFSDMDTVYVMPIYPANESPIPGVTSQALAELITMGSDVETRSLDKEDILEVIAEEAESFSVIVFMGAGNVVETANETVGRLTQHG